MKRRSVKILLTASLVFAYCLFAPLSQAEKGYYKWKNSRGNPQHSDRPPPAGVEYTYVSTETGLKRRVAAEESRATGSSSSAPAMPQTQAKVPNVAEQQAAITKNPEYCAQASKNLETLNSKAQVRYRNPDGSASILSGEAKEVQRQKARDIIAVHC